MAETAVSLFHAAVAAHPDRTAIRAVTAGGGSGGALTWRGWEERSRALGAALILHGHASGDRVAVLAGNRPLWPVAEMGILMTGGVSAGIYPTSAPGQVAQILADSGAVAVIVDTLEQLEKVLAVRSSLPALQLVVCEDAEGPGAVRLEPWLDAGARAAAVPGGVGDQMARRAADLDPDGDAMLIYTSGSTGEPKGARVSHRCLLASARSIRDALGLNPSDTALSFLPFCHAAERIFGLHTRILCGMEAGMVEDHTRLWAAAADFRPTLFGGLPRFFEKLYESLRVEQFAATGAETGRWNRVLELGREISRRRRSGAPVDAAALRQWRDLGEPLFTRLQARLGGRVRLATSGGANLPGEVAEYLDALGLTVLGAYGLTEHLCAAFNRPDRYSFDTAGPPMPGTQLRFAPDGEILIRRNELTFAGYHGRPDETRASFTADGEWLLTGDLGSLDGRGFLRIDGRKKELIALSNGKKVAPLPIESMLAEEPLVAQVVCIGEGRRFLSALFTLRPEILAHWAADHGFSATDPAPSLDPRVLDRIQAVVDRVNESLSNPERVRRFAVLDRELSQQEGDLTPTLKVRRDVVAERYRDLIDSMYLLAEA